MIPKCHQPDPNPRPPRFKPPPGATDTHFHIFGPDKTYPLVADRRFTPPDASVESYMHLHRTLGLSRAVLVRRARWRFRHA
jgi:predicted TIM-barrel fold metal-dependent hydrolase